jgi:hypothetical protein
MSATPSSATPRSRPPRGVRPQDLQTLHRLLNRLRQDEGHLTVANVVWLRRRHRVVGQLAQADGRPAPFEPAVVRCGPGARPIQVGMRLRLWRDEVGVYLQHCIP